MRLIACILALSAASGLAASGPAAAQSWKQYAYPDYAFAVSFPANPETETTTYAAPDGGSAQAHVYSVTQDGGVFKVTIVDLADSAGQEGAVIDNAIKTLSQGGEIKLNIAARVSRVFGRQLSILGRDGSRSSVALFYHDGRLYQVEGKSLPPGNGTADAIRFQQSLIFTDAANGPPGERARGERGPGARGDRPPGERPPGDRPPGDRPQRRDRDGAQRGAATQGPADDGDARWFRLGDTAATTRP
jgi:hypothetical protein